MYSYFSLVYSDLSFSHLYSTSSVLRTPQLNHRRLLKQSQVNGIETKTLRFINQWDNNWVAVDEWVMNEWCMTVWSGWSWMSMVEIHGWLKWAMNTWLIVHSVFLNGCRRQRWLYTLYITRSSNSYSTVGFIRSAREMHHNEWYISMLLII